MTYRNLLFNGLKFLLFLAIGLGILYLVYRNQAAAFQEDCALKSIPAADCSLLRKVWNDFRGINYFWILMVFVAYAVSNASRAIRWSMLLQSLHYQPRFINGFLTIIIGYFANLGLPRMGELVRAGTMARYEGIPVEKVIGTVVVDRIVDVLSILLLTALALLLDFGTLRTFADEHINLSARLGNSNILLYLLLGAVVVGLVLFTLRARMMRLAVVQKVVQIERGFVQGLQTVSRLKRPWLFILHSINVWLMFFLMGYFCFLAFAPTAGLGPVAALTAFVFGAWGMVVPSPGGMGTYHLMMQLALGFYGISGDDGFSFANISFFSVQLGCNILWGLLALLLLPILNRNYRPDTSPKSQPSDIE